MPVSGEAAVNAINRVFGRHRGSRTAHARGTVCRGVFTPTVRAAELTSAAHMQGPVDVTARFSNASGDPGTPDGDRDARGMAVKFHLPEGGYTDIVAVTLPCFFVRTREDFIELNNALRRNGNGRQSKLALLRLGRFVLAHPEARTAARAAMRAKPVPSYGNCRYDAIHAFKWTRDGGVEHLVRYRWRPEAGEDTISRSDAKKRASDYLQQDLHDRLDREPVRSIRFTLELQLASAEDLQSGRVCDATAVWPGEREKIFPAGGGDECERFIDAGLLELTGLDDGSDRPGDPLVFDPMNLTDGVEAPILPDAIQPSRDEILHFRPEAYDVSVARRTGHVDGDHP